MNVTRLALSPSPRGDHPRGDVLRDAARFAGGDVGRADLVEQRGLSVIDVTEDGHDRRTGDEVGRVALAAGELFGDLLLQSRLTLKLQFQAVFQRDRLRDVEFEA